MADSRFSGLMSAQGAGGQPRYDRLDIRCTLPYLMEYDGLERDIFEWKTGLQLGMPITKGFSLELEVFRNPTL